LSRRWGAHQVLIEEAGTAIGLLAELKHEVPGLTAIKPDKGKQTRMSIASAAFEAGEVHFPEQASWLAELEAELFAFPASRHDDQVDSISQAINHGRSSSLAIFQKLGASNAMFAPILSTYISPYRNLFPAI
jgi:predicted phage terminase large subunit-like protein